jgi:hypothetical protein
MKTSISGSFYRDQTLNEALVKADISKSFEEYFEILNRYYADDVEVNCAERTEPITGKSNVLSLISKVIVPLHVFSEVGGLAVALRYKTVAAAEEGEYCAEWTLELSGALGRQVVVNWSSIRRWNDAQVIYEWHSEHRRHGEPLTFADLDLGGSLGKALAGARPS